MRILKRILFIATVILSFSVMAFAESQILPKEKLKPIMAVGQSVTGGTVPATLLRYTVNYASGCDSVTGKGGTVISIVNRRPYSAIPTLTHVRVKFYNSSGQAIGDTGIHSISSPNFGGNSRMLILSTGYEWDLNTPLFPLVDFAALDPANMLSMSCTGYYGYAEIYSSHPAIQVAAFGVSGTGNVTELPMRRAKLPTVGGH